MSSQAEHLRDEVYQAQAIAASSIGADKHAKGFSYTSRYRRWNCWTRLEVLPALAVGITALTSKQILYCAFRCAEDPLAAADPLTL